MLVMDLYFPRLVDPLIEELLAGFPAVLIVGTSCMWKDDNCRPTRSHDCAP